PYGDRKPATPRYGPALLAVACYRGQAGPQGHRHVRCDRRPAHKGGLHHAQILLPALTWGEKDGTVTNSERRISRQRRFLPAPGAARADWQTVCDVAQRMGFSGFDYPNAAAIFREHASLSSFENEGTRDFDLSALNTLDDRAYDALTPIQWPVTRDYPLVLNTGRVRDQWHTMTRTGKSARLLAHVFEPCAEFHPDDARMAGVE